MTADTRPTPYPPADEADKKVHYWPEYVELADADAFTTDYPDQLVDKTDHDASDGPVGFHVMGPCPRCTCLTSDVFPLKVVGSGSGSGSGSVTGTGDRTRITADIVRTAEPEDAARPSGTDRPTPFDGPALYGLLSCRCPTVHFPPPGAPEGSKPADAIGCGSYWMAAARHGPGPTEMSIEPVPGDIAYRAWCAARAAEESTSVALTTIQTNASKWQTSMTAVLGLLVVTGLVGGRTVLQMLSLPSQIVIGLLAAISLVANVWSIFLLTGASSGRARLLPSGSLRRLQEADLEPLRQARTAEKQFGRAVRLVVISFGTALVALLCIWFAPAAASSGVDVTIEIGTAPRSTCGTITIDRHAGTFTVVPKNLSDAAATLPIAQLSAIGATC